MDAPKEKLPTSITVTVNGEKKEIFMSFALLNRLSYLIGGPDQIPVAVQDPDLREALLKEMLTERSKSGKILHAEGTLANMEDLDVSMEDIHNLLDFCSEHVLDFTLAGLEKSKALQFRNQARLLNLKPIPTGLPS